MNKIRILEANKSVMENPKESRVNKRQLKRKKYENNENEMCSADIFEVNIQASKEIFLKYNLLI